MYYDEHIIVSFLSISELIIALCCTHDAAYRQK